MHVIHILGFLLGHLKPFKEFSFKFSEIVKLIKPKYQYAGLYYYLFSIHTMFHFKSHSAHTSDRF